MLTLRPKNLSKINHRTIQAYEDLVFNMIGGKYGNNTEFKGLLYVPKYKDNKGQFGYYSSATRLNEIINIINTFGIKSLKDLGCGLGILLKLLDTHGIVSVSGYDNEPLLIDFAKNKLKLGKRVKEKDILTLKSSDIIQDCLFFWDPFNDPKLSKQFIDNLSKIIRSDQYIITRGSYVNDKLYSNKIFLPICWHNELIVWKKNTASNRKQIEKLKEEKLIQ